MVVSGEGDSCSLLGSLAVKFKQMVDSGKASGADSIGINNVKSNNSKVHDHGNYGNGSMKLILFASILKEQTNKKTVKLSVLSNDEIVNGAGVAISLVEIEEVSNGFANTLYGYIILKTLAFPMVENYVKNAWAKYGIERVMLHNGFFFQFSTKEGCRIVKGELNTAFLTSLKFIKLQASKNRFLKEDSGMFVQLQGDRKESLDKGRIRFGEGLSEEGLGFVVVRKGNEDDNQRIDYIGMSLITTKLGRPIMLDAYTCNMYLKSWGHNNYAWALIEVSSKNIRVDSLVVAIPFQNGSGHTMKMIDIEYESSVSDDGFVEVTCKHVNGKQTAKTQHIDGVCDSKEVENVFVQDNGKPIDGLFDDARKKVEAPPKKSRMKTGMISKKWIMKMPIAKRVDDFRMVIGIFYAALAIQASTPTIQKYQRSYMPRDRYGAHDRLVLAYFAKKPFYNAYLFRKRFRMNRSLFTRIVRDLSANCPYFQEGCDVVGKAGISALVKCTSAIRQLAYAVVPDFLDEYLQIGEKTSRDCLMHFCIGVIELYGEEYLRRPTQTDVEKLYAFHKNKHGFPGMIGSVDCTKWSWAQCSNNDVNVLRQSPVLNDLKVGKAPEVPFVANDVTYKWRYYLTDGIYPKWVVLMKSISQPGSNDVKRIRYKQAHEAARKDVE
ncbi:WAT1-related protein isoform X1 [Tanacetum coccineum]